MKETPATAPLAWYHVQFTVPAAWEMVRYRNNAADGRFHLGARHGETMQVHWRECPGEPALERRLSELVETNLGGRVSAAGTRKLLRPVAGWLAFMPSEPDMPVFAARLLPASRMLLNVSLPPAGALDHVQVAERILESFAENDGAQRRWAVYGMDVTLPAEYVLSEFVPMPTFQLLQFETRRGCSVTMRRHAMLSRLLADDTMQSYYARVKGRWTRLYAKSEFRVRDRYPAVKMTYYTRGKGGLLGLTARRWEGHVWGWRCDDIERLYYLDHHAPPKKLLPDMLERAKGPPPAN